MSIEAPPIQLESGDRLSREEFHRRYCMLPDTFRAELVQGVVYVASPVRANVHGEPHADIIYWLRHYRTLVGGARVFDNATVFLGSDDELQPDCCLVMDPPPDPNAARIRDDDYIEGPPQLIVEVAASSASYDLHDKLESYRRAHVPEYVVWRVIDKQLDWLRLQGGVYVRVEPDERGVVESSQFPGLRLHVARLLAGDMAGVLAELNPLDER